MSALAVTLSKVRHSDALSEETACFRAVVNLDGIPAFEAYNEGHGGMTFFDPLPKQSGDAYRANVARLEAHAAALPQENFGEGVMVQPTADSLVDDALTAWLHRKDFEKLTRSKLVLLKDGQLFTLKLSGVKPAALTDTQRQVLIARHRGHEILNFLPFEEGLAKYLSTEAA